MVKYSAIGAVGYVCGELLRMMVAHPETELVDLLDSYGVGQPVYEHFPHLKGFYDQKIKDLTEGESFASNLQLAYNNARAAAKIAAAYARL